MRFTLLALFSSFTARVLASVYAAPFEALYFYYAYRMEYDAVAADSTLTIDDMWLAPYCNPEDGSRRACNFNEFVHSVYDDLDGYTDTIDPDGYTRDTPLTKIAEDLHNAGFQRAHLDPTSLLKGLTVYNTPYYKVFKKVTDSVQWSRSKGATADLDRAREAISGVYGERKADNMVGIVANTGDEIAKALGVDFETQTETSPLGREYEGIDFDTMEDNLMAKHGNDFVAVQEILDQATNLITMISLINDITDKPGWSEEVFNDVKVASWRAEALARTCPDVKITSYINNLHPGAHKSLYSTIEEFISLSIQPWNDVLAYRDRGLCPSRIKTSGVVWWPPYPDWAVGLDKIERDRMTEEYSESKRKVEEYLNIPELPPALQQNMTSRVGLPTIEEDWEDLGLAWAVRVKHERLKHWLHPEPGISFTYGDWRQGKTGKALVGGRMPRKPLTKFVPGLTPLEPGPGHHFYAVSLKDHFLKQGLQVVVQLSTVELTPEHPVHINTIETSGAISLRVEADLDADAHIYTRGDLAPLAGIYGLADPRQLHSDSEEPNALQELGTIVAPDGRLVAYPNTLQHRVEAYELLDRSRTGHRRCLTVHLVDPHYRICSTRNVPPQQHDWWVEEGPAKIDWAGHHVPQEIINRIMTEVGEWPMGMEEATRVRDEVISEHLAGMEAVQDRVMRYQFD
ncbi:hypothetical protein K4K54_009022 [Colletotrichum sp. SAR 10_86]|nr:hypothetical protein K4K54_009022 [Colletotrichum sp. SAR 10_86]